MELKITLQQAAGLALAIAVQAGPALLNFSEGKRAVQI
jgi:hypothetical protein